MFSHLKKSLRYVDGPAVRAVEHDGLGVRVNLAHGIALAMSAFSTFPSSGTCRIPEPSNAAASGTLGNGLE
jgi:hypothetical protein